MQSATPVNAPEVVSAPNDDQETVPVASTPTLAEQLARADIEFAENIFRDLLPVLIRQGDLHTADGRAGRLVFWDHRFPEVRFGTRNAKGHRLLVEWATSKSSGFSRVSEFTTLGGGGIVFTY
jgi:hypothetical protein